MNLATNTQRAASALYTTSVYTTTPRTAPTAASTTTSTHHDGYYHRSIANPKVAFDGKKWLDDDPGLPLSFDGESFRCTTRPDLIFKEAEPRGRCTIRWHLLSFQDQP